MRGVPPIVAAASFLFASIPTVAAAQEDYRAADLDRPIKVEDAMPIEFRAWEVEVGSRGTLEEGARGLDGVLELKTGLLPNTQVGVEVEAAMHRPAGGGTLTGLEAAKAHVFYALRRETVGGPALALRLDGATPGRGDLGHSEAQVGAKAIASRSLGRLRVHLNSGYVAASGADGGDYWTAGLGGDYPIGLISRALLADVYAEIPTTGAGARVWAEVGMRMQLSNISVLDFGVATRLDEWEAGRGNLEIVIGFARVFGFRPRVDPYPQPAIR